MSRDYITGRVTPAEVEEVYAAIAAAEPDGIRLGALRTLDLPEYVIRRALRDLYRAGRVHHPAGSTLWRVGSGPA